MKNTLTRVAFAMTTSVSVSIDRGNKLKSTIMVSRFYALL